MEIFTLNNKSWLLIFGKDDTLIPSKENHITNKGIEVEFKTENVNSK